MSYSPYFLNAQSSGSSKSTASNFINASGITLNKGTPVSVNTSGQITNINVSSESSVLAMVGLTNTDLPASANGGIQDNGRLENVTYPSFNIGDPLWVSKTGSLTNSKPEIGVDGFVDGDWVIFVGVFVKNEFMPTYRDIKLAIEIIGQL
jgi:hypothetical protein